MYPDASLAVEPKFDGVQMGIKVIITMPDNKKFTYHVKTHSGGRLEENNIIPKIFDPKEIFIYKFLELSGLGPKNYIFHSDAKDVYIATLDAAHAYEQGSFQTAQSIAELNISGDIENLLTRDARAQYFAQSIVMTDLLSRLFRLKDLSDNTSNYGFTFLPNQLPLFRILDFRVKNENNFLIKDSHFGGFLEGIEDFDHACDFPHFMKYVLTLREQTKRFNLGKSTMKILHAHKNHIESAFKSVAEYIAHFEEQADLLRALTQYKNTIIANFDFLYDKFENYQDDVNQEKCA